MRLTFLKLLFLFTAFLYVSVLNAQVSSYESFEKFIEDMKGNFDKSGNQNYISAGERFENVWGSIDLSNNQKRDIMKLTTTMQNKNFNATGHCAAFFNIITYAMKNENLQRSKMNNFLKVMEKVVKKNSKEEILTFLKTSSLFFKERLLFKGKGNSLKIINGAYEFDYIGANEVKYPESSKKEYDKETYGNYMPEPQPVVEGPVIHFKNNDIQFRSKNDTGIINGTNGDFMFLKQLFVGNGGKFEWFVEGEKFKDIKVEFNKYNFNVTSPSFRAKNVVLKYSDKLNEPVHGNFQYKSTRNRDPDNASFPRFISFTNNVELQLAPNARYEGGITLEGKTMKSSSLDEAKATVFIQRNNKDVVVAHSRMFVFKESFLGSQQAETLIKIENDSIYHPGVRIKYQYGSKRLVLDRTSGGFGDAPFKNTYHDLFMSVDQIRWDMNENIMALDIVQSDAEIPAIFKSLNFFNKKEFYEVKGMQKFHPLILLYNYYKDHPEEDLNALTMSKEFQIPEKTFIGAMKDLHQKGFIEFNPITKNINLNEKTFHYLKAFKEEKDYDNIYIPSLSSGKVNAGINIDDKKLRIRGVERIFISDSLDLTIIPDNQKVIVDKGLNIQFNGKINTGIYKFKGKGFNFNYDEYLINLKQIDALKFQIKEENNFEEEKEEKELDNKLVNSSGTLYLGKPDNKSGLDSAAGYPKLDADSGAVVYFDDEDILEGTYSKDIYFKIPPFKQDSMMNNNKKAVNLEGTFHSDGMFPPFKETLKIMPDNSLGFTHKTPKAGYKIYDGKGKYTKNIRLDKKGIRGNGEVRYITAKLRSEDFVFYEDSLLGKGYMGSVKENVINDVPYAKASIFNYNLRWLVKKDSFIVSNFENPIKMYNATGSLEGSIVITPNAMEGHGGLDTKHAKIISPSFNFGIDNFKANHATFKVKSGNSTKPSLQAINAQCFVHLDKSYATISPEIEGFASIRFPYNQYKTSINKAKWLIDDKKVTMSTPEEEDIKSSYFVSTKPEQDSLFFRAKNASYDITKSKLNVSGIPHIKVADSKIFPDSGKVTIRENADMEKLTNASLIMDTINAYHKFVNGAFDILSKNKFTGKADYEYVNSTNDTSYITFKNFETGYKPQKKKKRKYGKQYTIAYDSIVEEDQFFISSKIQFKGDVLVRSPKKLLEFNGYVKLNLSNQDFQTDWVPFSRTGTSANIEVRIKKDKKDREGIVSGLHLDHFTNELYGTFLSNRRAPEDIDLMTAEGLLAYDPESNYFKIGLQKRIRGESYQGNMMQLSDTTASVKFSGDFSFTAEDPDFNFISVGKGEGNLNKGAYNGNFLLAAKYNLPNRVLNIMGDHLKQIAKVSGLDMPQYKRERMGFKLAQVAKEDDVAKEYNNAGGFESQPLIDYVNKLNDYLVLSDVEMKWSQEHRTWYSKGKLGISNVDNNVINSEMVGFVEIKTNAEFDKVNIYLQPNPENFYYLSYKTGKLLLLSSNKEFNEKVKSKSDAEDKEPHQYRFKLTTKEKRNKFVRNFVNKYLDGDLSNYIKEQEKDKQMEGVFSADSQATSSFDYGLKSILDTTKSESDLFDTTQTLQKTTGTSDKENDSTLNLAEEDKNLDSASQNTDTSKLSGKKNATDTTSQKSDSSKISKNKEDEDSDIGGLFSNESNKEDKNQEGSDKSSSQKEKNSKAEKEKNKISKDKKQKSSGFGGLFGGNSKKEDKKTKSKKDTSEKKLKEKTKTKSKEKENTKKQNKETKNSKKQKEKSGGTGGLFSGSKENKNEETDKKEQSDNKKVKKDTTNQNNSGTKTLQKNKEEEKKKKEEEDNGGGIW